MRDRAGAGPHLDICGNHQDLQGSQGDCSWNNDGEPEPQVLNLERKRCERYVYAHGHGNHQLDQEICASSRDSSGTCSLCDEHASQQQQGPYSHAVARRTVMMTEMVGVVRFATALCRQMMLTRASGASTS